MAGVGSTSAVSNVTVNQSNTTVEIVNQTLATANTEYSKVLPANCKKFMIKPRTDCVLRIAYASGETNVSYITLKFGAVYVDDNFYTNQTIYVQSNVGATVLEIISYY